MPRSRSVDSMSLLGSDEDISSLKGSDDEISSLKGSDNDYGSDSDSGSDSEDDLSDDENPASDMCVMIGALQDASNDDSDEDHGSDEDGSYGSDSDGSGSNSFSDPDDDNQVYRLAIQAKKGEKKGGRGYMWPVGATLRVRFLDGSSKDHSRIMKFAKTWEKYANIHFEVVRTGKAEIRISLAGRGYWSKVGTAALEDPQSKPTMNIGVRSKTQETELQGHVLHEFGHALGCIHEHSSPGAKIPWDKKKVYAAYKAPPNSWTTEMIDKNILKRIEATLYTSFDKRSIMLYAVKSELTKGKFSSTANRTLSDTDKKYIGKMYPFGRTKGSGEGSSKDHRRGKRC